MEELKNILLQAKKGARIANLLSECTINKVLHTLADEIIISINEILIANSRDLAQIDNSAPTYDRLSLTKDRLYVIADDVKAVATHPSPIGRVTKHLTHANGMIIDRISIPLGVVGVIYEARPNVTLDVFSLCLKSGNATVLKGGSDAHFSNESIVKIIHRVLDRMGIDRRIITYLPSDRNSTTALLKAEGMVDVIIPRGSQSLIDFVRQNSTVPIIETGAGICHTYFDQSGDLIKGKTIIFNAKTRRVSVCNALDCLIIHENRTNDLPELCSLLAEKNVEIYADKPSYTTLKDHYPSSLLHHATTESFGTEFLSYRMSIKTATSFDDALEHINQHSSRHSEAIIAEDSIAIRRFQQEVDAACVYTNVSTAFTDGAQFGLGAEIGISTQKLHARGPMGLEALTTYKYIIVGKGQIRE